MLFLSLTKEVQLWRALLVINSFGIIALPLKQEGVFCTVFFLSLNNINISVLLLIPVLDYK